MKNLLAMSALMLGFASAGAVAGDTKAGSHDYSQSQHNMQKEQLTRGLTFEKLDTNNDGVIEETEAVAFDEKDFEDGIEVDFETLDKNDDSEVSREEWRNYFAQM